MNYANISSVGTNSQANKQINNIAQEGKKKKTSSYINCRHARKEEKLQQLHIT